MIYLIVARFKQSFTIKYIAQGYSEHLGKFVCYQTLQGSNVIYGYG